MIKRLFKKVILITLLFLAENAGAWVFYEHRNIGVLAIRGLNPEYRSVLNGLWSEARKGHEERLTDSVIEINQGLNPQRLDYASWFAISGDHSCSPKKLLNTVLNSDWIINVLAISAKLEANIKSAKTSFMQTNYLHESDIAFQKADPEYATRAGSNNVHFLLAKSNVNTDAREYLKACLSEGAPANAIGAYTWFHLNAVIKAAHYARENLTPEQKSALALSLLADEAFGLHFLEDAFSAGHIAGTWGVTSVRKGTHDYYNERGLEVVTWEGKHMVVMGDAYMRPEDAVIAAATIRQSLEQVLDAASGKIALDSISDSKTYSDLPDSLDFCSTNFIPARKSSMLIVTKVLVETPVPGLATGLGSFPRFRSELGSFIGMSSALEGYTIFNGFGTQEQDSKGFVGGVEMNFRVGFGVEGVVDQSADGLVFIQAGWRLDASSTNQFTEINNQIPHGSLTSAIPGRSALGLRLRIPFWLIPGDMILAGPLLFLFDPDKLTKMGVVAANGGLIPWQSKISTGIGQFQFVLGREVGVYFYGIGNPKTEIWIPGADPVNTNLLTYHSTKWDFPILEYTATKTFSSDQSSSLMVQVTGGFDVPHGAQVVAPIGVAVPPLQTVWNLGMRILFNWRHYY